MILAGVLLKLGGYGIILVSVIILNSRANTIFSTISIIGGALTSLYLTRILDIKVVIAYSSVVHIRITTVMFLLFSKIGV